LRFDPVSVKFRGTDFWTVLLLAPLATQKTPGQKLRGNHATYVLRLIKEGLKTAADA
jgi:hypothetical protein